MNKNIVAILFTLLSFQAFSKNYLDENLKKENWNGVDVIFLEDNQYPNYLLTIYFEDGASKDPKGKEGTTEMALNLIDAGTNRYSQKEIAENLDFFGVSKTSYVTHEYSTLSVAGLAKDAEVSTKLVCHLLKDAIYPESEIKKYKTQFESSMKNIIVKHGELANRVFRELSFKGTPYAMPMKGKISTVKNIQRVDLTKRLSEMVEKSLKRIYIKGPNTLRSLKNTFLNDCGFSKETSFARNMMKEISSNDSIARRDVIYFLPLESANQAQIRIGRVLGTTESKENQDLKTFASSLLGGGFTSRLMQELRVKRGLTYSVSSYVASQGSYGRAGISTFTKNETLVETLQTIEKTIKDSSENIEPTIFNFSKNYVLGSSLFSLESSSSFLGQLLYFDNMDRDYKEIYDFPKNIEKATIKDVQNNINEVFSYKEQIKLVLGDKTLVNELRKKGYEVIVLNLKDYL